MHVILGQDSGLPAGLARASKEDALMLYVTHWQADVDKLCSRLAALLGVPDAGALQRAVAAAWPFENQVRQQNVLDSIPVHCRRTISRGAAPHRCCRVSVRDPGKLCRPSMSAQMCIAVAYKMAPLHQTRGKE